MYVQPLSCLNKNEEVAIIAAVMVVVIVLTVVITRAITEPICNEGWIEIAKVGRKLFQVYTQEGYSFERVMEIVAKWQNQERILL